ncbi:MCT-1/Tma20 like protein, partial [Aduncisulcus paluster]
MFKKFTRDDLGMRTQIKKKQIKELRTFLLDKYPKIEEHLDEVVPLKKGSIICTVKCSNRVGLLTVNDSILFFSLMGSEKKAYWYPTLRLIHKYPDILPKVYVHEGALKRVLRGSNVFSPGIEHTETLSKISKGETVAVYGIGKEH